MTTPAKNSKKILTVLALFFLVLIGIGSFYSETPLSEKRFDQIGNYTVTGTKEANPDGLLYTVKEIFELLKRGNPGTQVSVLGNFMRPVIRTDSNFQSVRYVFNCGMEICKVHSGSIRPAGNGQLRPLTEAEALSGLNAELKMARPKSGALSQLQFQTPD